MTPFEYEQLIGNEFKAKGFKIDLTPKSYDYGVDIIAENKLERIAIQVKMYENRQVNYKDVMYLFAGMHYYKCSKSVIITRGDLESKAKDTAKKLNVDFKEFYRPGTPALEESVAQSDLTRLSDFGAIWKAYIVPLQGQTILTGTGKKNKIIKVTGDYLYRESSTGEASKIEMQIFQLIYQRLREDKEITRQQINTEYTKRGSAIITAVLSKVPYIKMIDKPLIKLTWRNDLLI